MAAWPAWSGNWSSRLFPSLGWRDAPFSIWTMTMGVPRVRLELTRTPDELVQAAAPAAPVKKQRILGKEEAMANWASRERERAHRAAGGIGDQEAPRGTQGPIVAFGGAGAANGEC